MPHSTALLPNAPLPTRQHPSALGRYIPGPKQIIELDVGGFMLGELVAFALAFPVQVGLHAERVKQAWSPSNFQTCAPAGRKHGRPVDLPAGSPPLPVHHWVDVSPGGIPCAAPWPGKHGCAYLSWHQRRHVLRCKGMGMQRAHCGAALHLLSYALHAAAASLCM